MRMSRLVARIVIFAFVASLAACSTVRTPGVKNTSKTFSTVVVDAGHGGKDSGAYRRYGPPEKMVALDVAQRLEKKLRESQIKTVMTGAHVETIQTLFPQSAEKTFLLREFEEPGTTVWRDVPDPIGLGRDVYEDCARIIKNALPSVLAFVEQGELVRPGAGRSAEIPSYSMDHLSHQFEPGSIASKSAPCYGEALRKVDPEIFDAIAAEEKRQRENIELIASENFTSRAVMEAQGSVLTNKYAEGYPRKRWYGGCENVDTAEQLAIDRAKRLFGCEHVNVQPHSGAQANMFT